MSWERPTDSYFMVLEKGLYTSNENTRTFKVSGDFLQFQHHLEPGETLKQVPVGQNRAVLRS